ncbi:hypothetical protein ES703_78779 [subsurface metagenome]
MIDTEGYELRRLPWWYSPLTRKQVHLDTYSMLSFWHWMVEADVIRFCMERGFVGEEYLLLEGEFDRGELQEREAMFRVDQTRPITVRRYPLDIERIPEFYTPRLLEEEQLTTYTIIEKLEYLQIKLTFSIETGIQAPIRGHDIPFFAEAHANTTIQAGVDEDEIIRRVVNGVLKWFFMIFDAFKIVSIGDSPDRDNQRLIDYVRYLQVHAEPIMETEWRYGVMRGLDGFFLYKEYGADIMSRILSIIRSPDPDKGLEYFITRESVIAIGIEYDKADIVYSYPTVQVYVEKTSPSRYRVPTRESTYRTMEIAPTTSIDLTEILEIYLNITKEER